MATIGINPADKPAAPPPNRLLKVRWFPGRRGWWLIAAILVAGAGLLGYRWIFGKAKVVYATAAVERGDIESTVVAAGVLQPILYVDVGAQTSGKLQSLKVKRGDQVTKDQLLAEIDPVLANTALTSANATLQNITSQHALKQAQLSLAQAQRDRTDKLFADGLIATSDRDVAKANFDVASADVASLAAEMKQAVAAVDTAKANVG
jgi:membrane fusion protein, macrolide-specific efflux system